jgi:hypothetical protein
VRDVSALFLNKEKPFLQKTMTNHRKTKGSAGGASCSSATRGPVTVTHKNARGQKWLHENIGIAFETHKKTKGLFSFLQKGRKPYALY